MADWAVWLPLWGSMAPWPLPRTGATGFIARLPVTIEHVARANTADAAKNEVFLDDLGLSASNHFLGVGSGTQAHQTARIISSIKPDSRRSAPTESPCRAT
jgi:hypothetical protein